MHRRRSAVVVAVLLSALLDGCAAAGGDPAGSTAPAAAPTSTSATSWVMPDLVGADLQDAQDTIQRLTSFAIAATTSHDATGRGRSQVVDLDWRVCTQNVAPGAVVTRESQIDFGAVLDDEVC